MTTALREAARTPDPKRTYAALTPEQRARVRLAESATHAWELPHRRDAVIYASCWSGVWMRYTIALDRRGILRCDGVHCRPGRGPGRRRCVHVLAVEAVGGVQAARELARSRHPDLPPASATMPAPMLPSETAGLPAVYERPRRPHHFCSYDGCGYRHPERCPDCGAVRLVPDEGDGPCFVCWLRAEGHEPNAMERARYEWRKAEAVRLDAERVRTGGGLP